MRILRFLCKNFNFSLRLMAKSPPHNHHPARPYTQSSDLLAGLMVAIRQFCEKVKEREKNLGKDHKNSLA